MKKLSKAERTKRALVGLRWVTLGGKDVTAEHLDLLNEKYKCPKCLEWISLDDYYDHQKGE